MRPVFAEESFLLTTPEDFKITEEQETAWFQTNLDHPDKLSILAVYEGQIIGLLNFHNGERKRLAHLGEFGMSVAKDWRNLGIGRAMISTLLDWARQHPTLEKVTLQVFAANTRAIALYTSLGFIQEGRQIRQLKLGPGQYDDIILMGQFVKDIVNQ
jgi:RimJ/RimL family protein N-acetyltransferase